MLQTCICIHSLLTSVIHKPIKGHSHNTVAELSDEERVFVVFRPSDRCQIVETQVTLSILDNVRTKRSVESR